MTLNEIITAITTVGFPIVACVYMAYVYNKINTKLFEVVETNTEALAEVKEEMHHIATTVRQFTEPEDGKNNN